MLKRTIIWGGSIILSHWAFRSILKIKKNWNWIRYIAELLIYFTVDLWIKVFRYLSRKSDYFSSKLGGISRGRSPPAGQSCLAGTGGQKRRRGKLFGKKFFSFFFVLIANSLEGGVIKKRESRVNIFCFSYIVYKSMCQSYGDCRRRKPWRRKKCASHIDNGDT